MRRKNKREKQGKSSDKFLFNRKIINSSGRNNLFVQVDSRLMKFQFEKD